MWVKDKHSNESYIHVCNGKTERQMRQKKIEVRLHDITTHTVIREDNGATIEHIAFCPYCGVKLTDIPE